MPRQSRLERRAFKKYENNYLHNSMSRLRRQHDLTRQFELRLAERKGYQAAGTQMAALVSFLEEIGAEDVGDESAIPMALKVIKGYRERNTLLEQARLESDETITGLESDLETSRDSERKMRKTAVGYKSELTILRETHANAISTRAHTVSRGTGERANTDSLRTVRVTGVDEALR